MAPEQFEVASLPRHSIFVRTYGKGSHFAVSQEMMKDIIAKK